MGESQIIVQLNPDVVPSGSDLAVVNSARRSFNKRSGWDLVCTCGIKQDKTLKPNSWPGCGADQRDCHRTHKTKHLKEKDKRLIQFLARGMTADDFTEFLNSCASDGHEAWDLYADGPLWALTEKLWQWRNTPTHDTPFNHSFISFEVKAPIFVRAQLVKHEYLIMSEFSRRYITDGVEFYEPDYWRKAAPNKKQGSLEEDFGLSKDTGINGTTIGVSEKNALKVYMGMVDSGVAPEQARMILPQSTMTEWTWSGTLGAFSKMCQLRLHPEAQYEARLVAQQVYNYLKEYWPVSAKALVEGPDV